MNKANIIILFSCIILVCSCVTYEKDGFSERAKSPVQGFSVDTTKYVAKSETSYDTSQSKIVDSTLITSKKKKAEPRFKSKQDTLHASLIVKSKPVNRYKIKIEVPENPVYTVQIGAFSKASNALQAQKKAKDRFCYQPVFNNYLESVGIYRVSVGRYKDRKDAFLLRDTLRQKYPKEYHECWINFIE